MTSRKFYSVKECAHILGIHEQTVRQLIIRGELEAVYVGRVIRIPDTALNKLPQVSQLGHSHEQILTLTM